MSETFGPFEFVYRVTVLSQQQHLQHVELEVQVNYSAVGAPEDVAPYSDKEALRKLVTIRWPRLLWEFRHGELNRDVRSWPTVFNGKAIFIGRGVVTG